MDQMKIIKVELNKPQSNQNQQYVSLYGYEGSNDGGDCDPNGSTANCKC